MAECDAMANVGEFLHALYRYLSGDRYRVGGMSGAWGGDRSGPGHNNYIKVWYRERDCRMLRLGAFLWIVLWGLYAQGAAPLPWRPQAQQHRATL